MKRPSRPTQVDVAERAGVSRQTVSLVVQNDPRVSEGTRGAVEAAMAELGYHPNFSAQSLAGRRTGFLGIVLSGLENSFHAEIAEALRRRGEERGLIPFVSVVSDSVDEQMKAASRFAEVNVDGLILVSPMLADETISDLGQRLPTVLVTRNIGPEEVDLVHSDDLRGAQTVVAHLADAGYAPILYLGYERNIAGDSSTTRHAGYRTAMEAMGGEPVFLDAGARPLEEICAEVVERYGQGFGLACHNDLVAFQAVGIFTELGLAPGVDYGIAGYDNTALSAFPGVSLTSVDQRTGEMAELSVDLIIERIKGRTQRRDITVPLELIERRTTAPIGR